MTALDQTTQDAGSPDPRTPDELEFSELAARVDALREQVAHADPHARELLDETIEAITAFNRAGLVELVTMLRNDPRGEQLLFEAVDRPEVMALLVAHGIVRLDRTLDVLRAVDQLRPYLAASSVEMEVVRVEGDIAVVSFGGGCNAPSAQTRQEITDALKARVPGLSAVEEEAVGRAFVPLTTLRVGPP